MTYVYPVATLSGNEITDAVREAMLSGDGRASPDNSIGIWKVATNKLINGGFETNTTGWIPAGTNTIEVSAVQHKFGAKSCLLTIVDNTQTVLCERNVNITVTAAPWCVSCWIYIPTGWHGTSAPRIVITGLAGFTTDETVSADLSKRDQWQRIYTRFTPAAGDLSGTVFRLNVAAATAIQAGDTLYVDGAQVELSRYPTPYIETDGAAVTRATARVTGPTANIINETQSWVAMRMRHTLSAAQMVIDNASPGVLGWRNADSSQYFSLFFRPASNDWRMRLHTNVPSLSTDAASAAQAFSAGDKQTIIGKWDSLRVYISVNGGVFGAGSARGAQPVPGTAAFDIGSFASGSQVLGDDVLWFAAGTGTLTDAEAAMINAFGDRPPTPIELPGSATFVWHADGTVVHTLGGPRNRALQ